MKKLAFFLIIFFVSSMVSAQANPYYEVFSKPIPKEKLAKLKKQYPEILWKGMTSGAVEPAIQTLKLLNLKTTRSGKKLVEELKKDYKLKEPFQWDIHVAWIPDDAHITTANIILCSKYNAATEQFDQDWLFFKIDLKAGTVTADKSTPLANAYLQK